MTSTKNKALPVDLPEGDLITPSELAEAVASAIFPVNPSGLKGLKCIVGKKLEIKSETNGWDKKTLSALGIEVNAKGEFSDFMPVKLTPEDTVSLEKILPQFPDLQYPVSEETRVAFEKVLKNCPDWKAGSPVFIDEQHVEHIEMDHKECYREHLIALGVVVKERRVQCCDANHLPMLEMGFGAFIPREQARAYLQSIGLSVSEANIESVTVLGSMEMANKVDWEGSKYVSEKLRVLCYASQKWWNCQFDETRTKNYYLRFHEKDVVPMLKRPAFKARGELQRRAAEYIRPLYARRSLFVGNEHKQEFRNIRSPELTALLLASCLWDGWEKKGNKHRPTKSDITAAIKQSLPSWFQVTQCFMDDASKILQLENADTGREMQSNKK